MWYLQCFYYFVCKREALSCPGFCFVGLEFRLQVFEEFISVWRASVSSLCFGSCGSSSSCLFFPLSHLYASVPMSAVCLLVSMFTVFSFGLFPLLVIGGSVHVCITFLWLLPLLFTFVFFHVLCYFCFLSPSECPDCPVTLVLVLP